MSISLFSDPLKMQTFYRFSSHITILFQRYQADAIVMHSKIKYFEKEKKACLNFLPLMSSNEGLLDTIRFYFYGPWFLLHVLLDKLGSTGFLSNYFTEVGS